MKLAVLFSGGKDSCYALYKAQKQHQISCLLVIESKNPESYMFHTPNIRWTKLQAQAMNIPLLKKITKGEKEKELKELEQLIREAKQKYNIQGIVTGALASVYQSSRIQKICDKLNLKCINPLWGMPQEKLLQELIEHKFEVIIIGVFAYPLTDEFLGKTIDQNLITQLKKLKEKWKINPAGEGGEIETFVISAPMFKKKIIIKKSEKDYHNHAGILIIKQAELK